MNHRIRSVSYHCSPSILRHILLFTLSFLTYQPLMAAEIYKMPPVIVTAQKVTEELRQVPISITVIDEEEMENNQANQLLDLENPIPNLTTTDHLSMNRLITMRGVGGFSQNIGFDGRVGVYINGINLGQSPALNLDLLDIERVEVMRRGRGPGGA